MQQLQVLGPGSTAVPILMRTAESSSGAVLQVLWPFFVTRFEVHIVLWPRLKDYFTLCALVCFWWIYNVHFFSLQVDNFVDCEDEVSDDNDDDDGEEEDKKKLQSFLEDDFLSSNYSPSVLTISNSSKNQEVEESNTKDLGRKVDLDDESLKAAKELEICYLSGT